MRTPRAIRRVRRGATRLRLHRWRTRPYVSSAAPVVVGGCGRSGTTLLRVILDTHPAICCGPESGLLLSEPLGPARRAVLAARFDMDAAELERLLAASSGQAELVDRFFARYCEAAGKPRWADKTPRNVREFAYVLEHFPRARLVHVVRDGRDVVCSLRTHPRHAVVDGRLVELGTWNPLDACIRRWVRDVRAGLRFRGHPALFELRYEDLVAEPEATLRRLFEHLEEPWDERVLRFDEARGPSREVARFPQNPEATRPLYASAVGRWRSELTAADAALFKRLAGPLLVELGYADDLDWEPDPAREPAGATA